MVKKNNFSVDVVAVFFLIRVVHLAFLRQGCPRQVLHLFASSGNAQIVFLSEGGLVDEVARSVMVVVRGNVKREEVGLSLNFNSYLCC